MNFTGYKMARLSSKNYHNTLKNNELKQFSELGTYYWTWLKKRAIVLIVNKIARFFVRRS